MGELSIGSVEVDALFLANGAEVQGGLAYVLGGGWTRCWPPPPHDYPYERTVAIVGMIRVPWTETNVEHTFQLSVRDDDGTDLMPMASGAFKAGRQADLTPGASQLVTVALGARLKLDRPGIYHVVVNINGADRRHIQFEAISAPGR